MKRSLFLFTALSLCLASVFAFTMFQDWQIGQGYAVRFSGAGANGIFRELKGTIVFHEDNLPASRFDMTIDVASINTGIGLKNTHAKSEKWLDVKKYPQIRFISKEITKAGSGYSVKGELEMHGVKKELTIPFTFTKNGSGGVFAGNFSVNRNDFGIGEPGGRVDDVIKLEVSVPVTPK